MVSDDDPSTGKIFKYTPSGTLVQTFSVPTGSGAGSQLRDVVEDGNGNLEIYNGTFTANLTTLNPTTGAIFNDTTTIAGWGTDADGSYGGIAAYGNYVFVPDMLTVNDGNTNGLIRININDYSYTRFAQGADYFSVTLGQDGLLYAFSLRRGVPGGYLFNV